MVTQQILEMQIVHMYINLRILASYGHPANPSDADCTHVHKSKSVR